ncbi:hypothetical protein M2271_005689 [Streptomyces sp. LBL]|nr:hypothetical protein [Streptomyces sp. LBL]
MALAQKAAGEDRRWFKSSYTGGSGSEAPMSYRSWETRPRPFRSEHLIVGLSVPLTDAPWAGDVNDVAGVDINVHAGRPQEMSSYPPVESVRQMTSFSSVTITATESMSMKRASSGLTSVR